MARFRDHLDPPDRIRETAAAKTMARLHRSSIVVVLLALLWSLQPAPLLAHGSSTERVTYVALGDSVAEGIAATNSYGYVPRFRDEFATLRSSVVLLNAALGGFRSQELLVQLRADSAVREALQRADLVSISIGGNNLMGCASENFTIIDDACAQSGIAAFGAEWPQILAELRAGSPTSLRAGATLLVTTVYNPYTGDDPSYLAVEEYVEQVNAVIRDPRYVAAYGYTVVEVHGAFAGHLDDGRWNVCDWLWFCGEVRDPHPNDAGHAEIASLHARAYGATISRQIGDPRSVGTT